MGANYYWHDKRPCECCERPFPGIHIGKSSGGWVFSLHIDPENGIYNLDDWLKRFYEEKSYIVDEYGDEVPVDTMVDLITNRGSWSTRDFTVRPLTEDEARYACEGPDGLLRHKIDTSREFCVAHGPGSWDLMVGYFS